MVKTVFENSMVAHVWAAQSQNDGRSANGNFWFEGALIYSYRTPIAHMVDGIAGKVVLMTEESFSMTTAGKHIPAIWKATDYGRSIPTFRVPNIGARGGRSSSPYLLNHDFNLAHFAKLYSDAKDKAKRARTNSEWLVGTLQQRAEEADSYAAAFGLPLPSLPFALDAAIVRAYRAERDAEANTPAAIAKREKAAAAREARKTEEQRAAEARQRAYEAEREAREAASKVAWFAGDTSARWHGRDTAGMAYVRAIHVDRQNGEIVGGTLQTSMGADVPLLHAIRIFKVLATVKARGVAFEPQSELRVGHFKVDRINADGSFRAGCHTIGYETCAELAAKLGVTI